MIKYLIYNLLTYFTITSLLVNCELIAAETSVPFELVNGLMVIEAAIDGQKGNYILDTGSDAIILNEILSSGRKVEFASLTGDVAAFEKKVKKLEVGQLSKNKLTAFASDLSNLEEFVNIKLAGILGGAVFIPHSIKLDFEKGLLIIYDSPIVFSESGKKNRLKFNLDLGVPLVNVKIGNQTFNFIVDSGATTHFIDRNILALLEGEFRITGDQAYIITANAEKQTTPKVEISQISLQSGALHNEIFCVKSFRDLNEETSIPIHGLLSLKRIAISSMIIDLDQNQLYF